MLHTGQRGTACFLNENDIEQRRDPPPMGRNCFIGLQNSRAPTDCPHLVAEVEGHLTTIGSTRAGKTAGQIIPNLLLSECSSVVVDLKGEIAWSTVGYLRTVGFKVIILDPFDVINTVYGTLNASEMVQVSHYNPIANIDINKPNALELIETVVDNIVLYDGKETHWTESVKELTTGLIAYLITVYKEKATLDKMKEIISGGLAGIISIAKRIDKDNALFDKNSIARRKLNRYIGLNANNENREEISILSTAYQQFRFLDDKLLNDIMSYSDFSFYDLVKTDSRVVIFLVLPFHLVYSYNRWLRLMISMAIKTVSEHGANLNFPVTFYLDEFGSLGPFPIISRSFAFMAGRGMRLWIFVQNISQLKLNYPQDWENFISNSDALSIMNTGDYETAVYISNLLGKTTMESRNGMEYPQNTIGYPYMLKIDDNLNKTPLLMHEISVTYERFLMNPDEIIRLPDHLGILITREGPVIFVKAKCFRDEPFKDAISPNPMYENV